MLVCPRWMLPKAKFYSVHNSQASGWNGMIFLCPNFAMMIRVSGSHPNSHILDNLSKNITRLMVPQLAFHLFPYADWTRRQPTNITTEGVEAVAQPRPVHFPKWNGPGLKKRLGTATARPRNRKKRGRRGRGQQTRMTKRQFCFVFPHNPCHAFDVHTLLWPSHGSQQLLELELERRTIGQDGWV